MTTIDCQGLGRALHLHEGESSAALVDGFTLTRGASDALGSLVLVSGGSPVIRNCVIKRSRAFGGVVRVESGSPTFELCTIEEDTVVTTGAVMVLAGGTPKVLSCVIRRNAAPSAVRIHTWALISDTQITENDGHGMYFDSPSPSQVMDSEIARNTARGVVLDASSATFDGVAFQQNGAGGVHVIGFGDGTLAASGVGRAPATLTSSTTDFTNCVFSGHTTDRGAGFLFDCSNEPETDYTVTFTNCLFSGNHAEFEGGGVFICGRAINADITSIFVTCTIAINSAQQGGGIYMGVTPIGLGRSARAEIMQTILWGNCSTGGSDGEAHVLGGNEMTIDCSHSDLDDIAGTGSVYSSQVTTGIPWFCDYPGFYYLDDCYPLVTSEGDFGLAPESPAAPAHHPCGPAQIGAFPVEDCIASPIVDEPAPEFETELRPPAPNPFNPVTTLEFTLKTDLHVTLTIYDVTGRVARTLVDRPMLQGVHRIEWDGRDQSGNPAASGVYFLRFEAEQVVRTRKMVLLK